MDTPSRRSFLKQAGRLAAGGLVVGTMRAGLLAGPMAPDAEAKMRLGLVTYKWGEEWDIATIITNCEAADFEGVELRTKHRHGVEISLSPAQRKDVARRFADSDVELVGLGSTCEYHSPDPAELRRNIEETKAFVRLCHDVGGSGVKVRPNGLPSDVPAEKTLEQIGRSLREVAAYGADHGAVIRLEVHGHGTMELPHIKTIMDVADHPNATVCWNCNSTDLVDKGLAYNFNLVADRINTVHIHDLRTDKYPWQKLFALLSGRHFTGWTLLEDGEIPPKIPEAMRENRAIWEQLQTSP